MVSTTVFVTVLGLLSVAWGYSGGAPEEVCEDMIPKHPVDPQKSAFPYTVAVDHPTVKAGDTVKITISGGKPFKGYLLQVRDGNKAVGKFKIDDGDKYSKPINCFNQKQVHQKWSIEKHINHLIKHSIDMFHSFMNKLFPFTHDLKRIFYQNEHTLKNAATHKNSVEKPTVTLQWIAPSDKKTYTVYATVAENGGVFWTAKPTAKISVN